VNEERKKYMETKFYTLIIKTYDNGTADKTSLYTYDTFDEAISAAHTQWGQNVGADTIARVMAKVTSSYGVDYPLHTLYWEKPQPQPQPEEEETSE
jgi:hypothetical protein